MRLDSLTAQLVNLWSFLPGTVVDLDSDPDGAILMETPWEELRIDKPSAALRAAVQRMQLGPVTIHNILTSGPQGAVRAPELLAEMLPLQHLVIRTLAIGPQPVLSIVPLSRQARFAQLKPLLGRTCRLSRFAVLHTAPGGLCIESPLLDHRVDLHHPDIVGLLGRLDGTPDDPEEPHRPAVEAVRAYLVAAGLLVVADRPEAHAHSEPGRADGRSHASGHAASFAEDRDPTLVGWSRDDLLLHAASRRERLGRPRGATFAHVGRMTPPPVARPASTATERVPLPRPDLALLRSMDPPLSDLLERAPHPTVAAALSLDRLGALLYRAARVQRLTPPQQFDLPDYPTSERPYDSVDAAYALELYLVAGEASCLPAGAYHYDPLGHQLERMPGEPKAAARLAAEGPDALLLGICARLRRAAYKFSGTAYSNVLRDLGALQQTLTLVATALGLSARIVSIGDADAFQRAVGLDRLAEVSVGDMLVSGADAS
ncbi:SagB-type dehydrogenase family enzyme [Streptacidiphilus sp. MAP12-33]|uniref:SagB family peptide dehydrogenase n=1 Tax=Streptacidiphilus sp. MAP12-33 TaxID=3156266 RepID=UPI0035120287